MYRTKNYYFKRLFFLFMVSVSIQSCVQHAFGKDLKIPQWAIDLIKSEVKRQKLTIEEVCEPEHVGDDDKLLKACDIVLGREPYL